MLEISLFYIKFEKKNLFVSCPMKINIHMSNFFYLDSMDALIHHGKQTKKFKCARCTLYPFFFKCFTFLYLELTECTFRLQDLEFNGCSAPSGTNLIHKKPLYNVYPRWRTGKTCSGYSAASGSKGN